MNKIAIVIGATGLVGSKLVEQLLSDNYFSVVKIFVRRTTEKIHPKLNEVILNFDDLEKVKNLISGDVVFSCLGTTLKQAGSKENQYKVDYSYQYTFAKLACDNGVENFILVSAASANPKSLIFYSRIKGELEEAIKKLPFKRIRILQPSFLSGRRKEARFGEEVSVKLINTLGKFLPFLKKYRSISGEEVAKAMIEIYKLEEAEKVKIFKLNELFNF